MNPTAESTLLLQKRLYSIDGLKICSALLVFAFHSHMHLGVQYGALTTFISQGAIVMDLFFLLSGFPLYYAYAGRPLTTGRELRTFYRKRLISIYPLYLTVVLVFLLVWDTYPIWQRLLTLPVELLLLQSWFSGMFSYSHNGGTWFLSCLVFGYLVFPALKALLEKASARRLLFYGILTYILCAISPLVVIACELPNIYSNPLLRVLQFFEGMVLAAALSRYAMRWTKPKPLVGVTMAVASIVATIAAVNEFVAQGFQVNQYVPYGFVTLPLFLLLVTGAVWTELGMKPRGSIGKGLNVLKQFTYPVFMAQFFVWNPARSVIAAHPAVFAVHGNIKGLLLAAFLCAAATIILRLLIDIPCQKLLKKKSLVS